MKVAIASLGSRGDVEPFVALGHALSVAGHEVTIAAPADAASLVAGASVGFVPIDFDVHALMRSEEGQHWLASGNMRAFLNGTARVLSDAHDAIGKAVLTLADSTDLLVAGVNIDDYAVAAAQTRRLPLVLGYFIPWLATAEFPNVLVTQAQPPGLLATPVNRLTHRIAQRVYWRSKRADANDFRRSVGLPPAPSSMVAWAPRLGVPILHAYSTELVPRPRDWAPTNIVTGYWRLPGEVRQRLGEAEPPPAVADWLDAGPPPFFIGFGSMPILDPTRFVDSVVEAARRTRARVLIGAGWTELDGIADSLPEDVRVVGAIDHDALFPRCAGVIHHGGAGTTAASLTAGRPTWVYSLFSDQPYWGSRVTRLGVGGCNRFIDLDVDNLTVALRHLRDDGVRTRAAALGDRLRREDGLANAVSRVDRFAIEARTW